MMGKEAEFRSVQEAAVQAITSGASPVVAVMPTGSGKSLLFMLPAWAEQGGTTVVVVPLIAMRRRDHQGTHYKFTVNKDHVYVAL